MPKTPTRTRRPMGAAAEAARTRRAARPLRRELRFRRPPRGLGGDASGSGERARPRRRILVVDDESAIRTLCRVNLGISGMQVLEAGNGETAVRLARAERPDLILLDIMLPGETGWDVATELSRHAETRDIPVVFLTAMADEGDLVRGRQQGAVGYITKPFDPVGLGDVVEQTLERVARGEREQLRAEITDGR